MKLQLNAREEIVDISIHPETVEDAAILNKLAKQVKHRIGINLYPNLTMDIFFRLNKKKSSGTYREIGRK